MAELERELFRFRDRAYAFYLVWVSEYLDSMRQRSRKWETVSLPAADYRRLRRPLRRNSVVGSRRSSLPS